MSVFEMLGTLLLGPLKLIFEVIFSLAYSMLNRPGAAIIVLSLCMNVLVLPLYRRADAIQIAARDKENEMKDTVRHIKKTFSGDERMMILQTYYRQNNYSPLSVLSGTLSLLLEIPFFMAAYQFLSGVGVFQGASLGPIADLSMPDGLLSIGSFSVNVLPILMTVINVISSSLYLKGFPLKTKIQLYGMALFFLVFLYNSPAALVFYWALNNTFALLKTLYYKIKNSRQILNVLLAVGGGALAVLSLLFLRGASRITMIGLGLVMQLPWVMPMVKARCACLQAKATPVPNTKLFLSGALFLTVLIGLLIPSTFISASVQEFIDPVYFYNPAWYVVYTLCLSAGFFLVWLGVFYWLANPAAKALIAKAVWIASGVLVVNYMFFGTNLGNVSPDLVFTEGMRITGGAKLLNLAVIAVLAVGMFFLGKKFPKLASGTLLVATIALLCMGVINTRKISQITNETRIQLEQSDDRLPAMNISTEGQNVVVIMLDRGIGPFIPYIMEENPTVAAQFEGFTYYSNTLSYGPSTNFSTPSLHGGYDYTPIELNRRADESLADKHNEALKVVPTIMAEAGYEVSVVDPSYAGYQWNPDIRIYDGMDGVNAYTAAGKFDNLEAREARIGARKRNFFLFSTMKTMPLLIQSPIYDDGLYNVAPSGKDPLDNSNVPLSFMSYYNVLKNMDSITTFTQDDRNTYFYMRNNTTHDPVILQEPDFIPVNEPNNSAYYPPENKTVTANGESMLLSGEYTIKHYHANMAALIQLGNWFDSLREAGAYDNTKIIIVSDHGRDLTLSTEPTDTDLMGIDYYRPILLVKDFGKTETFTESKDFMTVADVAALSLEGVTENPVNPFTGNPITTEGKYPQEKQYVIISDRWDIGINNGTQFLPSLWACVSGDDISDPKNWTYYEDHTVFPPGIEE